MARESTEDREAAWIGDCVLDLFARSWILRERGRIDAELLQEMTSNQFLSGVGNPTLVEAEIGRIYQREGLEAAFAHIEQEHLPRFKKKLSPKRR